MTKTASKAMARASGAKSSVKPTRSVALDREHMSVSVRKIDNGYIICKSMDGPKGYSSTETYSASRPKIEVPVVKAAAPKKR